MRNTVLGGLGGVWMEGWREGETEVVVAAESTITRES